MDPLFIKDFNETKWTLGIDLKYWCWLKKEKLKALGNGNTKSNCSTPV